MDTQTLLKNTSRSLYLSVLALPSQIRYAFGTAYLLCRYADSIADTALIAKERRLYWVERFPTMLVEPDKKEQQALVTEIQGKSKNFYEEELLRNLPQCIVAFNALMPWQKVFIKDVVRFVCEGMRIDLAYFPAEDAKKIRALAQDEDLKRYCHLMGGAPGIFWSQLLYFTLPIEMSQDKFCRLGRDIGDALQIVNILRDVTKDLRIGRCYFPQSELDQVKLSATDLLNRTNNASFSPVKKKWIHWGAAKLKSAKAYYEQLPKSAWRERAAVAWPILWTADTLYKISQEPDLLNDNLRVKIPRWWVYCTIALAPFYVLSNKLFNWWLDRKIAKFNL